MTGLIAFSLAGSLARADWSTETFTLSYANADSPAKALADETNAYVLPLPQFNNSLGSLSTVILTLTSDDSAVLRIFNGGSSAVSYTSGSSAVTLVVNPTISGLFTSTNLIATMGASTANPFLRRFTGQPLQQLVPPPRIRVCLPLKATGPTPSRSSCPMRWIPHPSPKFPAVL